MLAPIHTDGENVVNIDQETDTSDNTCADVEPTGGHGERAG